MTDDIVTRRTAVLGLALVGVGVPVLAACGAQEEPGSGPADGLEAPASALAATADIPVGGGKVFDKAAGLPE